jgi:hypothetical protein
MQVSIRNLCQRPLVAVALLVALLAPALVRALSASQPWNGYGRNAQHTAIAGIAAQSLSHIHWQTPVDLAPQYDWNELFIHYGSPLVTAGNTVIVPVKTGAADGFQVEGRRGTDGTLLWTQTTDYALPPHDWTPSFSPTLAAKALWLAGGGGTVYLRSSVDTPARSRTRQLVFYGKRRYATDPVTYQANVYINTPLTASTHAAAFFGFQVIGPTTANLQSGIGRIASNGVGRWVAAAQAASDVTITKVAHNSAPALSANQKILYVAVNDGGGFGAAAGSLLALDSRTLKTIAAVRLKDPSSGDDADVHDDGTSSPTVGPDGDVYFGVLESPFGSNHDRGWLLHFDSQLHPKGSPGAFGWDDTVAIVPAAMLPSYHGTSSYLLMTKYNNYAGVGGDGVNRVAVLDPNASMTDPISGLTVMQEVLTVTGPTPDQSFPDLPNAVREWCINSAAVDPFTKSIFANNEDGKLYRWDMTTNTLSQTITLTSGLGEAYTPTTIGPDGTVYAINNATLFAVGN